ILGCRWLWLPASFSSASSWSPSSLRRNWSFADRAPPRAGSCRTTLRLRGANVAIRSSMRQGREEFRQVERNAVVAPNQKTLSRLSDAHAPRGLGSRSNLGGREPPRRASPDPGQVVGVSIDISMIKEPAFFGLGLRVHVEPPDPVGSEQNERFELAYGELDVLPGGIAGDLRHEAVSVA